MYDERDYTKPGRTLPTWIIWPAMILAMLFFLPLMISGPLSFATFIYAVAFAR